MKQYTHSIEMKNVNGELSYDQRLKFVNFFGLTVFFSDICQLLLK